MILRAICKSFINQSIKTWNILKIGSNIDFSLGEDSITDLNLLELQAKHPFEIKTQKYSNRAEGGIGADWEWWIGSEDNWLGFRVQAKKLDTETLTYKELDYMNRKRNPPKPQIDILIDEAQNADPPRIPLYVFYNYWDNDFSPEWECNIDSGCIRYEDEFGCGFSYAKKVKEVLNNDSKDLQDILKISYPWDCLICCFKSKTFSTDLPYNVFNFIKNAFKDEIFENYSNQSFIVKDVPNYVKSVKNGENLTKEEWKNLEVREITVIYQKREMIKH